MAEAEDFPSNSKTREGGFPARTTPAKKAAEPKEKLEKVVVGEVVRRKKPLGKRFTEIFVGGNAQSVWSYVAMDVLVPAAKDMIADAFSQGVERMLFGESQTRSRPRGGGGRSGSYTSYNRYSSPPGGRREEPPRGQPMSRKARATHDFDEIILATRVEADEVIERLFDLVARYEQATVADLYELVGQTGNFTDEKWGWNDIRGAGVVRVRNGYLLDLPRPEPID